MPDGRRTHCEWTETMNSLRARFRAAIVALSEGLIERDLPVRLGLLAALAGEHLLLVGPPGTAKSELARRLHMAFPDAGYFERLLTRFSVPEELFGPLSIVALESDRYERQTEGYLPSASIAFIDEVFKANSAILNALLTLLNEREFDNGNRRVSCPLISVVGATNEVPEDDLLAAFYDRFLLRVRIEPVARESFAGLVRGLDRKPNALHEEMRLHDHQLKEIAEGSRAVAIPDEVMALLVALRDFLDAEGIYVSDRRWRKIAGLLRVAAFTDGRLEVSAWDCWLLRFCAVEHPDQREKVGEWYERRLGVFEALDPERLRRVADGFEAQLDLEANASELNYDADGRLSMMSDLKDNKQGEAALRLPTFAKRRRYGPRHIAARVKQIEGIVRETELYLDRLDARVGELQTMVADHLWIEPGFGARAAATLAETRAVVESVRRRLLSAAAGFQSLPRMEGAGSTDESEPEPVGFA
ncbi:MAG TPA: AAA family ATPase [Rhodocyclaceae bacterium]|nr:AAA family ATPase [Rhodocyclaceae bacterium]